MKKYTDVDTWTIGDLLDCFENYDKKRKIILPRFQRQLVWKPKQKSHLIDSIKSSLPIGALLLYKIGAEEGCDKYEIIDGLQRTTAIRDYCAHPLTYIEDSDENIIKILNHITNILQETNIQITDKEISRRLIEYFHSINNAEFTENKGYGTYALINKVFCEIDDFKKFSIFKKLQQQISSILEDIKKNSEIKNVSLPIIIYSGPRTNLPSIFERINDGGTNLNKYQIYAAIWSADEKDTFKITNTNIIDIIRKKYEIMTSGSDDDDDSVKYEIQGFDPDKNGYNEKYSLFEYLFGFGKLVAKNYPRLFKGSGNAGDISSIGFILAACCIGLKLQNISDLENQLKQNHIEINKLGQAISETVKEVDDNLSILKLKANKQDATRPLIAHAEYQILSMVGKLFKTKYDITKVEDGMFIQNDDSQVKTTLKTIKDNIKFHYLYDILRGEWNNSVDKKLDSYSDNDKYTKVITRQEWDIVLDNFFNEEKQKEQDKRQNVSKTSILFLKYIYPLTAREEVEATQFDIEHLTTVGKLMAFCRRANTKLPISAISNLCLLKNEFNKEKGAKTIYEYFDEQLKEGELTKEQAEAHLSEIEKLSFTTRTDLQFAAKEETLTKDAYLDFLSQRFKKLKEKFYEINGIN